MAPLKDDIRWINQATGPVRDWDVFIEGLEPMRARLPDHAGLQAFLRQAQVIRERHDQTLRARLGSARYARFVLGLEGWLANRGWRALTAEEGLRALDTPVIQFAQRVLSKSHRRMRREGADFDHIEVEVKHNLRIRAKQLRYALQFFSSLYGKGRCREMLKALGTLQDDLGLLNDIVVADRLLDEAGLDSADPARSLIEGWFAARLQVQEGHASIAWRAFEKASRPWRD